MTNEETPSKVLTYDDLMQGKASAGVVNIRPCIEVLQEMLIQESDPELKKEIEMMLRETLDQACPF